MNRSFLAIIKRIAAEQGEDIFGDAQRLKPFIKSYADSQPKEDRIAFGRAIEQGFYMDLKRAAPKDCARVKASLVSRLKTLTGYDSARCTDTVNLLEAAITPAASSPQNAPVVPPSTQTNTAPPKKKINILKWIVIIGIVIAVWYFFIRDGNTSGTARNPLANTTWSAVNEEVLLFGIYSEVTIDFGTTDVRIISKYLLFGLPIEETKTGTYKITGNTIDFSFPDGESKGSLIGNSLTYDNLNFRRVQ